MSNTDETPKPSSLAGWKKVSVHTVTLPSSAVVQIKIPDLPALMAAGQIPQTLLEAALAAAGADPEPNKKPTQEDLQREKQFRDVLVQITVVEPKLSDSDIELIPAQDKAMIVEFALRQRDFDAVGDHIGGLTKSEKFRRFHRLDSFDSFLED